MENQTFFTRDVRMFVGKTLTVNIHVIGRVSIVKIRNNITIITLDLNGVQRMLSSFFVRKLKIRIDVILLTKKKKKLLIFHYVSIHILTNLINIYFGGTHVKHSNPHFMSRPGLVT